MSIDVAPGMAPGALIPGDSSEIERLAARLKTLGGGMVETAERLESIQAGEWKGPAGDAFRALIGEQPAKYDAAGSAFSQASSAIARYAHILREAQADAARAVQLHEQAHRKTQSWKRDWDRYDTEARTATSTGAAPPTHRPPETDPGAGDRAQAQRLLNDARSRVDTQARSAASILAMAEEGAPKEPGLLDSIVSGAGDFFGDVGDFLGDAWDATAAFLVDVGSWISDTWEDIDGPDLLRIIGGAALVIGGVVLITAAVPVEAAGVAVSATGVGIPLGVTINLGGVAMVTGGVGLIGVGGTLLEQGISGLIMHMARKRDLGQVDDVARRHGIRDRRRFGKWIETEKRHDPGTANERGDYTREELEEKAEEYKSEGGN